MKDADTTKAAATAMRRMRTRRKVRSGDIASVVPAKAGTHNHRPLLFRVVGVSSLRANAIRWLRVPAFAGTTAEVEAATR
jgi:hypothetical protein